MIAYQRSLESLPVERTARQRLKWDFRYRRRNWFSYYMPIDSVVYDIPGAVFHRWRYGELPMAHHPGDDIPDQAS
jgi:hypothetical protein